MRKGKRWRSAGVSGILAAAVLLACGRVEAQWGWPGYGGWGYGGWGYGGWGRVGFGMSLPQLQYFRMQQGMLNASRYNLRNAQAATAYQAANLYHQAAVGSMLNNYQQAYDLAGGAREARSDQGNAVASNRDDAKAEAPRRASTAKRPATFREMIAPDGEVFWPLGAPDNGELGSKRQAATRAIQEAVQSAKDGEASVRKVIAARQALGDYANPAVKQMQDESPDDARDFATYINTLDGGLRSLVGGPTGNVGGAADTEPPSAPKSAGEVLEKQVESAPKARKP